MEARPIGSDRPDSSVAPEVLRESSLMRSVNASTRHVSGTFAHPDPIAFFCECRTRPVIWPSGCPPRTVRRRPPGDPCRSRR